MASINRYSTKSLDFDEIREDLRDFLKSQDQFTDYDFEGSGLSQLINVLALNTHYNNVYDSFMLNESFIDTALKRSSVISHAALVNYVPRSARCATAKLNMIVTCSKDATDRPSILTIAAYSKFTTLIDGTTYTFHTISDHAAKDDGTGNYEFEDIEIYGGDLNSFAQTFSGDYFQCFRLESQNIDTTTISVMVDSELEGVRKFSSAANLMEIDGNSLVYFLKTNSDETINIQFGNGKLGAALDNGDIVYIRYLTSYGTTVNKASSFQYSGSLGTSFTIGNITCTQVATGGADAETTDEIRFNAPRVYSTQNRLVSTEDYRTVLCQEYPYIKSLNVWGGEEMDPPQYGKTYISIVKKDGSTLSDDEKTYIKENIIKDKAIPTAIIEFSDPTYIGVRISCQAYYDSTKTIEAADSIATSIKSAIVDFCDSNIGSFNQTLRYSQLLNAVDNADQSITNNTIDLKLSYEFVPDFDNNVSYTFTFGNAIKKQSAPVDMISSSGFYCSLYGDQMCYFDDDPTTGKLRIYQGTTTSGKTVVNSNAGTIDYETGKITINEITFTSSNGTSNIALIAVPANPDIKSSTNQFTMLDTSMLEVSVTSNTAS